MKAMAKAPEVVVEVNTEQALEALKAVEWYAGRLTEKAVRDAERRGFMAGHTAAKEKPELPVDIAYLGWNND